MMTQLEHFCDEGVVMFVQYSVLPHNVHYKRLSDLWTAPISTHFD